MKDNVSLDAAEIENKLRHTENHFIFDKEKLSTVQSLEFDAIIDEKHLKNSINLVKNKSFWASLITDSISGIANFLLSPFQNIVIIIGVMMIFGLFLWGLWVLFIKKFCKANVNYKSEIKELKKDIRLIKLQLQTVEEQTEAFLGSDLYKELAFNVDMTPNASSEEVSCKKKKGKWFFKKYMSKKTLPTAGP